MTIRPRTLLVPAALLVFGGLPPTARAQDSVDPVDPLEDQALREEAAAHFEEALENFRQAFKASVDSAGRVDARERNLARAEVLLEKIVENTERVSRQKETEEFLAGFSEEELGAVLQDAVRWTRAGHRRARGDDAGARELLSQLGLVNDWWVLGPFDNERGRGFGGDLPWKGPLDLAGEYPGKERPVKWRRVPVKDTFGYVDLDALLRPNDQAAAYALAFVRSETETDGALRLGSDEAVRAWWNGSEVLTRDVRRRIEFDQDVVGVHLSAGWNVLLLKVCDQTGSWGFRVRLTASDGSALSGVTFASTDEEAAAAASAPVASTPPSAEVAGGARRWLETVEDGGATARDLFHLGWLHSRREFDSYTDRRAENLLRRAAEMEPDNAVYRFHFAEAAAPPIEMAVEKEENRQRQGREKAIELDPGYAVAYRALAAYYTNSLVNLERAESLLRRALEVNPDFHEARMDLALVLERRGLPAAAEVERARVLDDPRFATYESRAREKAQRLERLGRVPEAVDAWRAVLAIDDGESWVRDRIAELAVRSLGRDDAHQVLDQIILSAPFTLNARRRKAELYEGAAEWENALTVLASALEICPEDDDLLQAVGRVQRKAGQDDKALATLREALRVNPKLQSLERYVNFLDPEAAPFEDAYRIEVQPFIDATAAVENPENDPYLTLVDHTVTKVNQDGTTSNYVHMAARILNNQGAKRFKRYFAQSWGGQSFKWKVARVIKADGSVVEAKKNTERARYADFPPLVPGDVVDVEYRSDDREQSFFGDYYGTMFFFADSVPMKVSSFTLITPAKRTFHIHQRNFDAAPEVKVSDDSATRVYTWTSRDIAKVRSEPGMPDAREIYPQVQVSTYANWDEFAKWWWSMIRDQHVLSDDMKAKVEELVAGKETRLEKIRAIYEFVTGEVTYQAWEFGVHGYKPYVTTAIFDKREGDCKDKAILMNTLLGHVGVEAHPVLIYAAQGRSEEDLSLAMVNHFNHCISYVPDVDGAGTPLFLDGTAQYHSMQPPAMDRSAKVLIVRPEGAEIMTIPELGPESMGIEQKWDVTVREDGGAKAVGTFTVHGDLATLFRRIFSVEGQRPMILQGMMAQVFGKVKVESHEFSDLKDLAEPKEVFTVTCDVPEFATRDGDALSLPTQFLPLMGQIAQLAQRPEREFDLILGNPGSFVTEATYRLPEGWQVEASPAEATIDSAGGNYTCRTGQEAGTLTLRRELRLVEPRVRKEDYGAFREAVNQVSANTEMRFRVKRAAAPAGGAGEGGEEGR